MIYTSSGPNADLSGVLNTTGSGNYPILPPESYSSLKLNIVTYPHTEGLLGDRRVYGAMQDGGQY